MKLQEAIDKLLADLKDAGRSPATIVAYRNDLLQLVEFIGDVEIKKITTKNLEEFVVSLENRDFKNKTISRKLNSVKSLFKILTDSGKVLVNPSKAIPHPDIKQRLPNVLSDAQYLALREASKTNTRTYALIELMLQTGMRIGEISRLKLEDIQLNSRPPQILVTAHASSPMRIVELNDRAKKAIEDYIPTRMSVEGDEGYLFNTKNGSNMIVRNIRSSINRMFHKAGIIDLTVNDIRNTFIFKQLDAGVSLAKVANIVGHKRFSSTEKFLPLLERDKPGRGEKISDID